MRIVGEGLVPQNKKRSGDGETDFLIMALA
jgi:hypothetical protein